MGRLRRAWKCKWWAAAFLIAALCAAPAAAEPQSAPAQRIDIQSDRLQVDNVNRVADFTGNVVARQADTTIEADRIRVHYKEGGGESVEAIEKIVAAGNVRIRFENGLAETPEAVYNVSLRVFVLTGAGSRVSSGSSYIEGEKITMRRDDGRVTVEGGQRRQVEAVFYPEGTNDRPEKNSDPPGEDARH